MPLTEVKPVNYTPTLLLAGGSLKGTPVKCSGCTVLHDAATRFAGQIEAPTAWPECIECIAKLGKQHTSNDIHQNIQYEYDI